MVQRTTASDVAKAAGVSRATVSFVLNATPGQSISDPVRARVRAEASRLGYSPHPHARALASGQSRIILMTLPTWPTEYVTGQLIDEATVKLDEAGFSLITIDPRRTRHATPLWETLRPDALISVDGLDPSVEASIKRAGVHLVRYRDDLFPAYRIGPDLQIAHLLASGHVSIAYASTGVPGLRWLDDDRLERVRRGAAAGGSVFRSSVVSTATAKELVGDWVASGVTAVAAFNDGVAATVIGAALRAGLRVPDELAVIGHDDAPFARMMVPSISTIALDLEGLGRNVALRAIAAASGMPEPNLEDPVSHVRVVLRESA